MANRRRGKSPEPAPPAVRRRKREAPEEVGLVRTFCGLALGPESTAAIEEVVREPRRRLTSFRWVPPEKWHVTLKFYGAIPESEIEALAAALARTPTGNIPVELRGVGAFPDMRGPRVLWVGVKDPRGGVKRLHRAVNDVSDKLGYEHEDRKFRPHITLARVKKGGGHPVVRELTALLDTPIQTTVLQELILWKSELTMDGAIYKPLRRIPLLRG